MTDIDLYLEFGGDLKLMCRTSFQEATGWDAVRQRIIRRILTNPAQQLPDGSFTTADYIFDATYGIGLGALVGQDFNQEFLAIVEQRISAGVLADSAVATTIPPSILFQRPAPDTLNIFVGVTLTTGQTGQLSLTLTK